MDNSSNWFDNLTSDNHSRGVDASQSWFEGATSSQVSNPWDSFQQKAKNIVKQRGLPDSVTPAMLGQAAIESARGTSNFAKNRNNYFGYQAYDSDPNKAKGYGTPEESINDYLDLIMSYKGVPEAIKSGDPQAVIKAIKANGYATDPNYVNKVMSTPEFQGGYN